MMKGIEIESSKASKYFERKKLSNAIIIEKNSESLIKTNFIVL
jgi:hypothetical protein